MSVVTPALARDGGTPVWTGGWPAWPQPGPGAERRLLDTLHSDRWAVSGPWTGRPPLETRLAAEFAAFTGARWCLPVDHGSSALITALHAIGVRPGDEVIVPGLTWVASASAVARAGAVPVLVDIDPRTLCLDPQAVADAVTPATAAIIAVHLYSAMSDMDALRELADLHGLALIEDAAQAYGATWRGRGAGSLGIAGAFSAQQGKTLTSGEGGLFVTSDPHVRERAEMLRGDGRRYARGPHTLGRPDLEEADVVQGWNMHLSEFQSALLLDGLERLPGQNRQRAVAAGLLDELLTEHGDLLPIDPYPGNDQRAYYHYVIRLRDGAFAGHDAATVAEALSAELGYWIHPPYQPLDAHPLYDPRRLPGTSEGGRAAAFDPARFHLPAAHREARRALVLHHPMLLGSEQQLHAVAEAFDKVRRNASALLPAGGTR